MLFFENLLSPVIQDLFHSNYHITLFSLLAIISVVAARFINRFGVPALVLFLCFGMLAGSDGLQLIEFSDPNLAQIFGTVALVIILFDGGMQTKWHSVRPIMAPALTMATVGVVVTAVVVGIAAKQLFAITWLEAMLLGSIVGSTDAAAVFAVLSGKNIKDRLARTLEAESGTNDPMAVFLTISFITLIQADGDGSILKLAPMFVWQMGVGLAVGYLLGRLTVWVMDRIRLDSGGLYPVLGISAAFFAYGTSSMANASGFLAVYVLALVIGNADVPYRHSIFRFNEGFAWMMQMLMFIVLGLLVFPGEIFADFLVTGLILSGVLIFIARPLGVGLSLLFYRYSAREFVFLAWSGLRGAVPIVLATYPLLAGLTHSQDFFNVVFFVVLTSTLVQGTTILPLARWLGLEDPARPAPRHSIELVTAGRTNMDIIEYTVSEEDEIVGQEIRNLKLPPGTLITAIIRNDQIVIPSGSKIIQVNDLLFVMLAKKDIPCLKQLLTKQRVNCLVAPDSLLP